jgi:hypothetical protein
MLSILALGAAYLAPSATAGMLTIELDEEFSGASEPAGTAPWLTAEFNDGGGMGSVTLTLTSHLTDVEFVSGWYFNLDPDPDLDPDDLAFAHVSGPAASSIDTGSDGFKADGDGFFDFVFNWSNGAFGAGDETVYTISGIASLTALSFDFGSVGGNNGSFWSAAHVQGIGDDGQDSGWIGGQGTDGGGGGIIPEPSSMTLCAFAMLSLAGYRRFRRKLPVA